MAGHMSIKELIDNINWHLTADAFSTQEIFQGVADVCKENQLMCLKCQCKQTKGLFPDLKLRTTLLCMTSTNEFEWLHTH